MTISLEYEYSQEERDFVSRENRANRRLAMFPTIMRFLGRVGRKFLSMEERANYYRLLEANRNKADLAAESQDQMGYQSNQEVVYFLKYRDQIHDLEDLRTSEAEKLYQVKEAWLSDLISDSNSSIRNVFNLGVLYAYVDSILAERFPKVNFIGIDRSPITKLLNENEFSELENMEFLDQDAFDVLKERSFDDSVFLHARTFCLLSRALVEDFYKAARDAGFEYVVGFEQFGIPRKSETPYVFDTQERPSEHFRGSVYIHNYPHLLKESGFEIVRGEVMKTGHPHPDFRLLCFVAKRVSEGPQ